MYIYIFIIYIFYYTYIYIYKIFTVEIFCYFKWLLFRLGVVLNTSVISLVVKYENTGKSMELA